MGQRLPYADLAPDFYKQQLNLNMSVKRGALESRLLHLVNLRVSQINGCAYCVDLHLREALADGEDLQRLNSLMTWREVDFYTPGERAALAFAEDLTLVAQTHAPDASFDALRPHFSDRQIAELGCAIALINSWNRLAIGFRKTVVRRPVG